VSDVKREAVAQSLIGEGEPLDPTSPLFHQVLESVIDQKLLANEARKRGLGQDAASRHRLEMAQDRIMGDILLENSVQKAVTENAIRQLYQQTQNTGPTTGEFHARQIVTATEGEAQAVKRLIATGATFESLVLTKSIDAATRFSGGDLGYITPDVMPDQYAAALKTAKTGQIVGPFQIDDGWALLKIEDRRPEAPITLEAARPQIVRFLTYGNIRDLLETLRRRTKVELLIDTAAGANAPEPASAPAAPGALPTPQAAPPAPADKGPADKGKAPEAKSADTKAAPAAKTAETKAPAAPPAAAKTVTNPAVAPNP
jgi:peptidyl-prolyl cis-trans isomerase C